MVRFVLFLAALIGGQSAPVGLRISGETSVDPYRIVRLKAEGHDAKAGILWRVKPLDPRNDGKVDWASKRNAKTIEFVAPPGQYLVDLLSGKLGASGEFELDATEVVVTIGAPIPPDPPDPPPTPTGKLYFMLVRPDGPASPAFTEIAALPGWDALRKLGHQVKDFELTRARELGANIPTGSPLPCVVAIRDKRQVMRPDGTPVLYGLTPQSMPETLPEGFK